MNLRNDDYKTDWFIPSLVNDEEKHPQLGFGELLLGQNAFDDLAPPQLGFGALLLDQNAFDNLAPPQLVRQRAYYMPLRRLRRRRRRRFPSGR